MSAQSVYAPIALFVFKRPDHTLETLKSLASNPEFQSSPLFIYCDGARSIGDVKDIELTRLIVRNWSHPNKTIIEAEKNQGLAKSIILGVTHLTEKFQKVIVVEDDLVVRKDFLGYLNTALDRYEADVNVMQISAYMFPVSEFSDRIETIFLPNISSWGWATWRRAWQRFDPDASGWKALLSDSDLRYRFNVEGAYDYSGMLLRQMNGEIDSWAIRWNWSVFINGGLVLYPPVSTVRNAGFDGSGTHCSADDFHDMQITAASGPLLFSNKIEVSRDALVHVKKSLMLMSGSFFVRVLKAIRSFIHRVGVKIMLS